jgi:16S rRNA (adenine1518-N6/adenine1519-N6)-dimethyltransferase
VGRRLGQHFLFDPTILDRIVAALRPEPDDLVLEIGPGRGTLTARLLPHVRRVIAVETDRVLAERLEAERGTKANLAVVRGDALRLDWRQLAADAGTERFKVVGNIPYAITSPLIEKALAPPPPPIVVYLVQREVADRLAAAPGSKVYGALTVGVQAVAAVELLFGVPAGAFRPPPRVESAAVRLVPLERPLIDARDHRDFRAFVQTLFSRRRKQLGGTLRAVFRLGHEEAAGRLAHIGVLEHARPAELTVAQFVALFEAVARSVEADGRPPVDSSP